MGRALADQLYGGPGDEGRHVPGGRDAFRGDRGGLAAGRGAAVAPSVRQAGSAALDSIDKILAGHDGKRLANGAGSLGTVPVETTAEGIRALAESDQVKAILEDQKVVFQVGRGAL